MSGRGSLCLLCCARYREDGRTLVALRLALGFDFADEHGRSDGADGDCAGLGAALAVEDFALVACGEDALHGGEGGSYDADAAYQLVWPAISIDTPHDEGNDLESLWRAARGDSEAGGDVFEVKAVGLALFPGLFDQLFA